MSARALQRKLIEVALPLDAINAESAREKSIRHGHPSTLHLWWARRPLAACRAVLFAQLVDDPSAHPDQFPTEEAQDAERERLFKIIRKLVKWENATNEEVLDEARVEIRRSFDGNPPTILDPFAGGGSIPLEAQRLGLEAHASDLNPVAVLINKALIEIPPKWTGQPPVHLDAEKRTHWKGADGLAEDVRRYGQWMRDEAERRIGHLYPKATLPDGNEATVIAWIWARTVTCPNPACGATMPLAKSFWLGKKKGKEAWVMPVLEGKTVRFEIGHGPDGPMRDGTVGRAGAICIVCESSVPLDHIRAEGKAKRMHAQMMAIVVESGRGRTFLPPTAKHEAAAVVDRPEGAPDAELPPQALGFRVQNYGVTSYQHLFTDRQAVLLTRLGELVEQLEDNNAPTERLVDIKTYLLLSATKMAAFHTTLARWRSDASKTAPAYGQPIVSMVWDFAETNPFAGAGGDWAGVVNGASKAIERLPSRPPGLARQADARDAAGTSAWLATDPPYYDNIGYADLSDIFYVWLRRPLQAIQPGLATTLAVPKHQELISAPFRHKGSKEAADHFFESGFIEVFGTASATTDRDAVMTLFYAFKQEERTEGGNTASTGWSTMLEGLATAGWMVTATWPIQTEGATRLRAAGANALASSVVLACRPRPNTAGVTDRQGLVRALREELPGPLHELQKANIQPVDLRQAAIGPGMAVFSRYAKVIEPDGSTMRVRTALGLINQVLGQVLDEQEGEFDDETRWAIQWFSQHFESEGPYGVAEQLAVSMNVAVSGMVESGILRAAAGKARLLDRHELPDDWDPTTDLRTPVWEATQHLVKRLEIGGEAAAGALLAELGGLGDSAHLLAYRLYTVCESTRPALAGPYNALVASWPEIQRLSHEAPPPPTAPSPDDAKLFDN